MDVCGKHDVFGPLGHVPSLDDLFALFLPDDVDLHKPQVRENPFHLIG